MRKEQLLLVVGLCTASAVAVAAPMYRWVDKNGVVQYTQTPPPGMQAETVRPAPPPSPGSGSLKKYSDDYNKAQAESAKKQGEAAALQEKRDAECKKAQAALEKMESVPLRRQVEQDDSGTVTRMTAEKQAELLAEARESVSKNCTPQ